MCVPEEFTVKKTLKNTTILNFKNTTTIIVWIENCLITHYNLGGKKPGKQF